VRREAPGGSELRAAGHPMVPARTALSGGVQEGGAEIRGGGQEAFNDGRAEACGEKGVPLVFNAL
jgi:hypothetical protein